MIVHEAAHEAGDFGAGFQALSHFRTTQVKIAVFQARFFGVDVVGVQRQRFRAVDDGQVRRQHFDFAGGHLAVNVALFTRAHGAGDLDAELITQFGSQF